MSKDLTDSSSISNNKTEVQISDVTDSKIKSCYDNLPINDKQYEKIYEFYDHSL